MDSSDRNRIFLSSVSMSDDENESLKTFASTSSSRSDSQLMVKRRSKSRCRDALTVFNAATSIGIVVVLLYFVRSQKTLPFSSVNTQALGPEGKQVAASICNCANGGTCWNGYKPCQCLNEYKGTYCELANCNLLPCRNNGTCVEIDSDPGYKCNCAEGYLGKQCQFSCKFQQCYNGGTCVAMVSDPGYTCDCTEGYRGKQCQLLDCKHQSCNNGGTCVEIDSEPGYKCYCTEDYLGKRCQYNVAHLFKNYCSNNHCQNNGTCLNVVGNYSCMCAAGFFGRHCESALDAILSEEIALKIKNMSSEDTRVLSKLMLKATYNISLQQDVVTKLELIGQSIYLSMGYQNCTANAYNNEVEQAVRFWKNNAANNKYNFDKGQGYVVIPFDGRYFIYAQIAVINNKPSQFAEYAIRRYRDSLIPGLYHSNGHKLSEINNLAKCHASIDVSGPDKQLLFCSMLVTGTLRADDKIRIMNIDRDLTKCIQGITFTDFFNTHWGLIYLGQ